MKRYTFRDVTAEVAEATDRRRFFYPDLRTARAAADRHTDSMARGLVDPKTWGHTESRVKRGMVGSPYAVVLDVVEESPEAMRADAGYPDANPKAAIGARKARLHLVPPALTILVSDNMGDGADKYGPFNWRAKPVSVSTYVGAMERHLQAYRDGEDIDPESASGATHLGAIGACVGILADAAAHGTLVDDRVKGPAPEMIRARTRKE